MLVVPDSPKTYFARVCLNYSLQVMGPTATQKEVYDAAVRDVVDDVLKGERVTLGRR